VDHEALKGDFHAENREGVLLLWLMELMLEISFQARVDDTDCRLGVLSVEFVRQF
jgi:hypothetical protein